MKKLLYLLVAGAGQLSPSLYADVSADVDDSDIYEEEAPQSDEAKASKGFLAQYKAHLGIGGAAVVLALCGYGAHRKGWLPFFKPSTPASPNQQQGTPKKRSKDTPPSPNGGGKDSKKTDAELQEEEEGNWGSSDEENPVNGSSQSDTPDGEDPAGQGNDEKRNTAMVKARKRNLDKMKEFGRYILHSADSLSEGFNNVVQHFLGSVIPSREKIEHLFQKDSPYLPHLKGLAVVDFLLTKHGQKDKTEEAAEALGNDLEAALKKAEELTAAGDDDETSAGHFHDFVQELKEEAKAKFHVMLMKMGLEHEQDLDNLIKENLDLKALQEELEKDINEEHTYEHLYGTVKGYLLGTQTEEKKDEQVG